MTTVLYIFIGGGLGSLARYGFGIATKKMLDTNLPIGTFLANLFSCLIVGIAFYILKDKIQENTWIQPFVLIGFCGGLSTFSTFSNETAQMIQEGNWFWAILNIVISISFGVGMIFWLRYKN
ncbi:MAG: fluoride efflux transporter CrcB [Flavobacteriia bacterium]|nr:fluoride efflux transporter CrcB [Flavobacteriia bacterium]